jgi:hypothetical protein
MHVVWAVPQVHERIVQASATLEVLSLPTVPELWFWALQASFGDAGGAHLGLQWYDPFPGSTGANFGGYDDASGRELTGPGENTRAYSWQSGRPYRLTIATADPGSWSGRIDGEELRVLRCGGSEIGLSRLMVWTECFARCDAPPAAVRWSGFETVTAAGEVVAVRDATLHYQELSAGGCSTGRTERDGDGWLQTTGVSRTHAR